jgi:hypothetical protein
MDDNISKLFNCLVKDIEVSPDRMKKRISIDNYHEFDDKDNNDGALGMAMPLSSSDAEGIQKGDIAEVKFIGSEHFVEAAIVVDFKRDDKVFKSFQLK